MEGPIQPRGSFNEKKKEINLHNFYPGALSEAGFLAEGEDLNEVIARDRATCEQYGLTPKDVGQKIAEILRGERKDEFDLKTQSWRGMQECPFDKGFKPFSSLDFTITNKKTDKSFSGPGLIAHLLTDHDFFEGNTSYRVDPEEAIEVLFEKS